MRSSAQYLFSPAVYCTSKHASSGACSKSREGHAGLCLWKTWCIFAYSDRFGRNAFQLMYFASLHLTSTKQELILQCRGMSMRFCSINTKGELITQDRSTLRHYAYNRNMKIYAGLYGKVQCFPSSFPRRFLNQVRELGKLHAGPS